MPESGMFFCVGVVTGCCWSWLGGGEAMRRCWFCVGDIVRLRNEFFNFFVKSKLNVFRFDFWGVFDVGLTGVGDFGWKGCYSAENHHLCHRMVAWGTYNGTFSLFRVVWDWFHFEFITTIWMKIHFFWFDQLRNTVLDRFDVWNVHFFALLMRLTHKKRKLTLLVWQQKMLRPR